MSTPSSCGVKLFKANDNLVLGFGGGVGYPHRCCSSSFKAMTRILSFPLSHHYKIPVPGYHVYSFYVRAVPVVATVKRIESRVYMLSYSACCDQLFGVSGPMCVLTTDASEAVRRGPKRTPAAPSPSATMTPLPFSLNRISRTPRKVSIAT